jgi:hypothetical protein
MSEFQYYEFQALDRPLSGEDRDALRDITSRAEITSTRLTNVYHYGDFRGDPEELMEQYFDAFLYLANWGTRKVMLRLPRSGLSLEEVEPFLLDDPFSAWQTDEHLILSYEANYEGGGEWVDEDEASAHLAGIIPIREELMRGDHRPLYLGWLLTVALGYFDEKEGKTPSSRPYLPG